MKVGIVTFTYGDNYGQRLQNYAVQEILRRYSKDVLTIPSIQPKIKLKRKIKKEALLVLTNKKRAYISRNRAFRNFDEKHIRFNLYAVNNCVLNNEAEFDYFIAGSDQIWSPYSPDVNESMFLTFTKPEKRIALSPSISADEIPEEKETMYKNYFNGFQLLSVREEKAAELIFQISGKKAQVLIDPTLSIDRNKWEALANESSVRLNYKYVLVYCLGDEIMNKDINRYAQVHGYKVVNLFDKPFISMGPCEFLYLINNAQLVVTDSYHGTIFSCIFHKRFILIERAGRGPNMNSRFETLFNKLCIDKRNALSWDMQKKENINYQEIDKRIEIEKQKMISFLEKALCLK